MSYYAIDYANELAHHGILGMKWGVRRFQNEDGSLTSAGKIRYYGAGGDRRGYYREKGAAKRYKDAIRSANTHHKIAGFTKGYREWVKQDPDNRKGLKAQYEMERVTKMLGGKKSAADARYAYEHKNLAKYVNRDGSLTTAGKLRYWDTNAARGEARKQRDIARDKKALSPYAKTSAKLAAQRAGTVGKIASKLYGPAVASTIVGSRQKDPTKYMRKNASDMGKTLTRLGVNAVTGNAVGGVINGTRLAKQMTVGNARAIRKTAGRVAGNVIRGTAAATMLGANYGVGGTYRKLSKSVKYSQKQVKNDLNNANYLSTMNKIEKATQPKKKKRS